MANTHESSTGLYRFVIILILFCLLYWVLAGKMLGLYDEVEQVVAKKSKDEFVTSINHIRHQWMRDKQSEVEMSLVGQSTLTSEGLLKARVNRNGFATHVVTSSKAQCDGLFENLQSIALSDVNSVEILDHGQIIGCKYYKNSVLLFKYMFLNGIVSSS